MPHHSCDLKVVLLCKGKGADPNTFQPNRDESQWFCRRDALVRCITSFLFGPTQTDMGSRELIMVFDDDLSRIHMTRSDVGYVKPPTEHNCLSALKTAARRPNTLVVSNDIGLKCILYLDPTYAREDKNIDSNASNDLPPGLDSKRQVLEYLQKHCSLDFLRSNSLNSKPDVILRKTNKDKLMNIWSLWLTHTAKSQTPTGNTTELQIGKIFTDILTGKDNILPSNPTARLMTAILHESYEEFPCYGLDDQMNQESTLVYMFLGAVRDMSKEENQILIEICDNRNIPLARVRFGTVPEFTSKILSLLSFHHSENKLGWSLLRLLGTSEAKRDDTKDISQRRTCLHVISTVPLDSESVSTDLSKRDHVHWSLVRIIVCTLWRSKLVSSKSMLNHTNSLHLLFNDGVLVSLEEGDFVTQLAEQHRAAPSEFQILQALKDFIHDKKYFIGDKGRKRTMKKVFERIDDISDTPLMATIALDHGSSKDLIKKFYTSQDISMFENGIALFHPIDTFSEKENKKMMEAIFSTSSKRGMTAAVYSQRAIDAAAGIICIQHFCYQSRLFLPTTARKRKLSTSS
jgi:hypothetical protein